MIPAGRSLFRGGVVLAYVVGRLGKLAKPIELEIFGLVPMTVACTLLMGASDPVRAYTRRATDAAGQSNIGLNRRDTQTKPSVVYLLRPVY